MYASDIEFALAHCCAKVSVALLLRRLGRERLYTRICDVVSIAIAVWGVASTLAIALKCDLIHPWLLNDRCINVVSYSWEKT
jgi:hypothetical protein